MFTAMFGFCLRHLCGILSINDKIILTNEIDDHIVLVLVVSLDEKEGFLLTNKNQKLSVLISLVLTYALLGGLVLIAVFLPSMLTWYLRLTKRSMDLPPLLWGLLYAILAPSGVLGVVLLKLLGNVRAENVFQPSSVRYLRILYCCCFVACLLFLGLTLYFPVSPVIAFAIGFIGLMLREVRKVVAEGVRIKSENDLTV